MNMIARDVELTITLEVTDDEVAVLVSVPVGTSPDAIDAIVEWIEEQDGKELIEYYAAEMIEEAAELIETDPDAVARLGMGETLLAGGVAISAPGPSPERVRMN